MLKPFLASSVMLLLGGSLLQSTPAAPGVPADAARMVNPGKTTPAALVRAKTTYGYDCAMCHGDLGDGKGDIGATMTPKLKDYTDPAALKDLTDGEIFYIIKNGKGTMQGEGDRVKTDDLWAMVVVVRSFARK